jgi:hypothetical protein
LQVAELDSAAALSRAAQQAAIDALAAASEAASVRGRADAAKYSKLREAAANEARLTPAFLSLQRAQAHARNTEYYWGNAVPSSIVMDSDRESPSEGSTRRGSGGDEGGEDALLLEAALATGRTSH